MTIVLSIFLFLAIFGTTAFAVLFFRANLISQKAEEETKIASDKARIASEEAKKFEEAYLKIKNAPKLVLEKATLEAYRLVEEAKEKAIQLINNANHEKSTTLGNAKIQANRFEEEAKEKARQLITQADNEKKAILELANEDAIRSNNETKSKLNKLIYETNQLKDATLERANQITFDANKKVTDLEIQSAKLKDVVKAYENKINGYGDEYLIPIESVIDELGNELAYTEPAKQFKETNKKIKDAIKRGFAAKSKISNEENKERATEFVLDAFLGKVETSISKVKSDNFGKLKQELMDSFALVNLNGAAFKTEISKSFLDLYLDKLKWGSILQKIKGVQQEEQRLIREGMREEERVRKEAEKAQKEAIKEEEAVQKALAVVYEKMAKASEEEREKYEQQINELNERVTIAEEKRQRALSMAQQTKMGHVYIISNVGSFGEDVYKIGLTRRLEPQDRIDELGDSSVPFTFDVHAFIKSNDAPALEHQLHKHFILNQVNKVNHRKEFFRVPLSKIREEVEKLGLESNWTMTAEAIQYKESKYIEKLIDSDPDTRMKWESRQLELDDIDLGSGFTGEKSDDDSED